MVDVVWLGEPAAHALAQVGAKAANLSRIASTFRVPPGFCLTASAMDRGVDALRDRIFEAYARLGAAVPVSVRSSAIDEDSAAASFAGQHETCLNVRGAESVLQSVVRCVDSLHTSAAMEYRRQHGLTVHNPRLAVLVQRMVEADASAVIFTAHPVTHSRDHVVLTATWGLGESLVGGTVSPDTYVLDKSDLRIADRAIATKRTMTILADEGTREVEVGADRQSRPAVEDAQVVEAARVALQLEQTFGWPVDVECAWENQRLHILQCRPITTLRLDSIGRDEH